MPSDSELKALKASIVNRVLKRAGMKDEADEHVPQSPSSASPGEPSDECGVKSVDAKSNDVSESGSGSGDSIVASAMILRGAKRAAATKPTAAVGSMVPRAIKRQRGGCQVTERNSITTAAKTGTSTSSGHLKLTRANLARLPQYPKAPDARMRIGCSTTPAVEDPIVRYRPAFK